MAFNWEMDEGELNEFQSRASDLFGTIGEYARDLGMPVTGKINPERITTAVGRAIDSGDIGKAASELYAGGLNIVGDIAEGFGVNMGDVPEYTGESAGAYWPGIFGDEEAARTPVTTRSGEEKALEDVSGFEEMRDIVTDVKTGAKGLVKTAQLGALNELWNTLNANASKPITSTANTIEQLLDIDNRGLI